MLLKISTTKKLNYIKERYWTPSLILDPSYDIFDNCSVLRAFHVAFLLVCLHPINVKTNLRHISFYNEPFGMYIELYLCKAGLVEY